MRKIGTRIPTSKLPGDGTTRSIALDLQGIDAPPQGSGTIGATGQATALKNTDLAFGHNHPDLLKEREEIVYGLTNLPRQKASARRLLALKQRHWAVENRLHSRRDVTPGEDACQVRVKGAPLALAAFNGGVLALMDGLQVTNVASQMRHLCARPHEALHLLPGKLSRYNR